MNSAARQSVADAFAEILAKRRPDLSWSARPVERSHVELAPRTREVVGSLAAPEDQRSVLDRDIGSPSATKENRVDASV
jgi:hypothetical protein